jgi:glycosyltransferase involved in cell wall biosynthesis
MQVAMSYGVAVPTLNAARDWIAFSEGLTRQTLPLKDILILDSMSVDGTTELAAAAGSAGSATCNQKFDWIFGCLWNSSFRDADHLPVRQCSGHHVGGYWELSDT